eukprot:6430675-Alexandrium_andersonii.AAC.1
MSASLVGSEMCIRDSQGAPESVGLVHLLYLLCLKAGTERILASSLACTCLLYTSDAADDM